MNIIFKSSKFHKECNDSKLLQKRYGTLRAKLIRRRLDDLYAAPTLETIRLLPQTRCHELHGDRAGQLSVDLDHPYRLIFEPADNPIPRKDDGGLDWNRVTTVSILGVEDIHE